MTWSDFYLICFAIGFLLSFVSFISGGLRWHLHIPHLPHGHLGGGHLPMGHGPATTGATGSSAGARGGTGQALQGPQLSPFNFITLTAFLAWFGGTGYLLTRFSSVWFVVGLVIALIVGLIGAAIIFLFLSRVLSSPEECMDPADYEMVGVLGRTSISIREGGTGEIIYSQAGTRRTCGARSEDNAAIEKGCEVVVTRYDRGLAYVKRWEEISGE